MAEVLPFRATCYNPKIIPDLSKVVTQPYDKITPAMQDRYYAASPYNLVRLLLGRRDPDDNSRKNVYTRAAASLRRWIDEAALVPEPEPAFFPYFQEYEVPGRDGLRKLRKGFVGLGRVEDYSKRIVHRHEETLTGPKQDRLELLKATRTHFGQLFMLYSDPSGEIERILDGLTAPSPWKQVTDEYGVGHRLWRAHREKDISAIVSLMKDKPLIIADGHHRYETALAYRDLCREQGLEDSRADFTMMTFVRMEGDAVMVLPTHRLIHGLQDFDANKFRKSAAELFELEEFDLSSGKKVQAFRERLREAGQQQPTLGAVAAGIPGGLLLRLKKDVDLARLLPDCAPQQRALDVVLLHRLVIEKLLGISREEVRKQSHTRYLRDFQEGIETVSKGDAQLCLFLNPTPTEKVRDNALAGLPLPQKSTDFYPKLLSGLTLYWMDNPLGI